MTGAMAAGSLLNSGLASRVDPARLASIGLGVLVAAGTLSVAISAQRAATVLPRPILGPVLIAFGIALAFPVLQLRMLDLFPARRGAAASTQSFTMPLLDAAGEGLVPPLVSSDVWAIASTSGGFGPAAAMP